MKSLIKQYRELSFEQRTMFHAKFSIIFNFILACGKIVLGFFVNSVFFVTGTVNIFMMLSRYECYVGATKPNRKSFQFRNTCIGIFLILAGLQYMFYMILLLIARFETRSYSQTVGILIAFVAFIELGVAIKGCFNAYGKGHYYRNIKITNLCTAFTAIALAEMAITSFASQEMHKNMDCWFGIGVGLIIVLNGIWVFIAPKVSIIDRRYNVYEMTEDSDFITESQISFRLTHSKIYGNYTYEAQIEGGRIEGKIEKNRSPIFNFNIGIKLILIILSEILIFPYAIGAFIFHVREVSLICKLDKYMEQHGCIRVSHEQAFDLY